MKTEDLAHEIIARPTRNPKNRKIQCRIDEETDSILIEYCRKYGTSESAAIREGIRKLNEELQKQKKGTAEYFGRYKLFPDDNTKKVSLL